MDTNGTKTVAHGLLDFTQIRDVEGTIRNDADTLYFPMSYAPSGNGSIWGVGSGIDSTNIILVRQTGSSFDSTNFDSTGYNRGWLKITYEA